MPIRSGFCHVGLVLIYADRTAPSRLANLTVAASTIPSVTYCSCEPPPTVGSHSRPVGGGNAISHAEQMKMPN